MAMETSQSPPPFRSPSSTRWDSTVSKMTTAKAVTNDGFACEAAKVTVVAVPRGGAEEEEYLHLATWARRPRLGRRRRRRASQERMEIVMFISDISRAVSAGGM